MTGIYVYTKTRSQASKQRRHLCRVSAVAVIVVHALVRDAASRCVTSSGYGVVGNALRKICSHEVFELAERELDRIEFRRIWRKKDDVDAHSIRVDRSQHRLYDWTVVGTHIVHNHDIPTLEGGHHGRVEDEGEEMKRGTPTSHYIANQRRLVRADTRDALVREMRSRNAA